MRKLLLMAIIPTILLSSSCKKTPQETPMIPINISTAITKVTDTAFEQGDAVGLYVVNQPATLSNYGNHANNVKFTFSGTSWDSEQKLYWPDETTKGDFYVYFPYSSYANTDSYSFSVQRNQSTDSGYKSSEFLVGQSLGITPTSDPVLINVRHLMSCLRIELKAGTGLTEADLENASVTICGLQTQANIKLEGGGISPNGDIAEIQPLSLGNRVFRALVVPQSVNDSELLRIKLGSNEYSMKTSATFVSGKQHTCIVTVNRTGEGINVGIDPWGDGDDYNGTVE